MAFHEMFRHTDFLKMAAYTMALSWIDCSRTEAAFSTTGVLFKALPGRTYGMLGPGWQQEHWQMSSNRGYDSRASGCRG